MKNIIILGAGMVGKAMAIDLAKKHSVTSTDIDEKSLEFLSKNALRITLKEGILSVRSVVLSTLWVGLRALWWTHFSL